MTDQTPQQTEAPEPLPCTCLYSPDHPEHKRDPKCPTHRRQKKK